MSHDFLLCVMDTVTSEKLYFIFYSVQSYTPMHEEASLLFNRKRSQIDLDKEAVTIFPYCMFNLQMRQDLKRYI